MKTQFQMVKFSPVFIGLVLLSFSSKGQDRNVSTSNPEPVAVEAINQLPAQLSTSEKVLSSETSNFPRPVLTGNRDADVETYRNALFSWAKENPGYFSMLDEGTKELFQNEQYSVLFDQALIRIYGTTEIKK